MNYYSFEAIYQDMGKLNKEKYDCSYICDVCGTGRELVCSTRETYICRYKKENPTWEDYEKLNRRIKQLYRLSKDTRNTKMSETQITEIELG